jgi:CBS domain-containing protein
MKKVSTILNKKKMSIVGVPPTTSVFNAIKMMAEKNIGSILVMEGDTYLGLMTERDYTRKVILKGKHSDETTVGEIMTTDLPRVRPSDSLDYCMQLMADGNVRYLPVFDNGRLVGIVSIIDAIQQVVALQKETIGELQNFISSNFA